MRCEDPTTFQSLRPRLQATPPSRGGSLPVSSTTPPSQLLKRTLQSSRFSTRCWVVPRCVVLMGLLGQAAKPNPSRAKMRGPGAVFLFPAWLSNRGPAISHERAQPSNPERDGCGGGRRTGLQNIRTGTNLVISDPTLQMR